jgi:CheY-like chemotaxis protein
MRVLVVDDNADMASSLATLLTLWGHEPFTACTGFEALEVAARCQPEVVLIDLGLPGMDGYELAGRLRGLQHIAMTGHQGAGFAQRSCQAGFRAHLLKPFEPAELERLLHQIAREQPKAMPSAGRITAAQRGMARKPDLLPLACQQFWLHLEQTGGAPKPIQVARELRRIASEHCVRATRLRERAEDLCDSSKQFLSSQRTTTE